ncbi:Signal transduction histidine kinase [Cyclonatronum proteinivorum]|uniref:histidine kinase n=1 Tax=Cyclonatronum proteinivorum TaxID=1457365 RepID=A0A345UIN3_9BACT|nr:HAMP domain-containing sensor histidine kinase [Cyclonatronum proteinivorum]AXJ00335.1 Signal transduction histidine kinase [Cyclonatronum proteinivorum]
MRIQFKLSLTFILLLVFGVTAISSYSIVFIRGYLMNQAEADMRADANQILVTLQLTSKTERDLVEVLPVIGRESIYDIRVFDHAGELMLRPVRTQNWDPTAYTTLSGELQEILGEMHATSLAVHHREEYDRIFVYGNLYLQLEESRYTIEISRLKSEIYQPVHTIRWIIYSGMFVSIAIILFVSFMFSNYLARPITQLTQAAKRIAGGETEYRIELNRSDEFGTLAQSLNQMSDRLRQENEKLLAASNRQKQFYADIAHEIRNPLHTISGALEMLDMNNLPDEKRTRFLQSARNQSQRMNRLFQDLMTLQRSDLDPNFVHPRNFVLSKVMMNLEQAYSTLAEEKKLKLVFDGPAYCSVYADPNKIEQVLDNLISNALKYSAQGTVEVRWRLLPDPLNQAEISVKDTGIGIQAEHIPYLFDRFYRTDKARSRDSGGTGLGLSVVKTILDAHRTEISVESAPGKGTRMTFRLPKAT